MRAAAWAWRGGGCHQAAPGKEEAVFRRQRGVHVRGWGTRRRQSGPWGEQLSTPMQRPRGVPRRRAEGGQSGRGQRGLQAWTRARTCRPPRLLPPPLPALCWPGCALGWFRVKVVSRGWREECAPAPRGAAHVSPAGGVGAACPGPASASCRHPGHLGRVQVLSSRASEVPV